MIKLNHWCWLQEHTQQLLTLMMAVTYQLSHMRCTEMHIILVVGRGRVVFNEHSFCSLLHHCCWMFLFTKASSAAKSMLRARFEPELWVCPTNQNLMTKRLTLNIRKSGLTWSSINWVSGADNHWATALYNKHKKQYHKANEQPIIPKCGHFGLQTKFQIHNYLYFLNILNLYSLCERLRK